MPTIAFHGDYANGEILKRDMGDPPWVDKYFHKWDIEEVKEYSKDFLNIKMVGFSRGGSFIAHLSHYISNIRCVVLYESPVIKHKKQSINHIAGDFPALIIWNNKGFIFKRGRKNWAAGKKMEIMWAENGRPVDHFDGEGGHMRLVWNSWPPVGHDWDVNLNNKIGKWIDKH
jgi:hypothetical protein